MSHLFKEEDQFLLVRRACDISVGIGVDLLEAKIFHIPIKPNLQHEKPPFLPPMKILFLLHSTLF